MLAPPAAGMTDDGFQLVDTTQPTKGGGKGKGGKSKGKGKAIAVNYQEGILGARQRPFFQQTQDKGKGGKGKKGKGGMQRRQAPSFKEWSVQTKTEWEMKREIMLSALCKLQLIGSDKDIQREDVMWCGKLHEYNKEFDRLTLRTKKTVTRFEDLNFFNVTTSDDPLLPDLLQQDPDATVIATDHVLASLIAAARSVYSWDIVVTKIAGKLIFDKRDGSQIDYLTVNETAQVAPEAEDPNHMNSPQKLGQEASCVNQNFSQMVLDMSVAPTEMEKANPFEEDGDGHAASVAYRYQKITLPGNPKDEIEFNQKPLSMIVRTEVNAKMPETGAYVSVKALTEYDPKPNDSWAMHLETQRGKVLATELKNNAFKLGRWTAQAILAGCDVIKMGFVTRRAPSDPWSHQVLGMQTHYTQSFAEQMGMSRSNAFGILRNIVDLVMQWDDGKYLILKDPTKPVMRIYAVPWDELAEEEEDEGDGEEEDTRELDEDGNVVPQQ